MKKTITNMSAVLLITAMLVSCGDDDNLSTSDSFLAIEPSSTEISAVRNTTITIGLKVNTPNVSSITANGSAVALPAEGSTETSFDFSVPANDPVGTEYNIEFKVSNGEQEDSETVTVKLAPGAPLAESNLAPLATVASEFANMVSIETLLSSSDELDTYSAVGGFQLGGSADGMGMVENSDGNFELLVNCEDHYSVVRVTLNSDLRPMSGDYLLNSSVADFARQCSGTMWEKDIHGGAMDLFISSSESFNYSSRGIDPFLDTPDPDANYNLPALGQFAWENNVPLPAGAYSGETVVIGGDDDSSFSEGQVALYYSESGDMDLTGGKIYVLKRKGATTVETEADLDFGVTYDVEFVEIPNGAALTKDEMEQASVDALSLQFMRVEDLDYGKGSDAAGRTVYFAVTGRGPGRGTYNDWGTGYKLVLDEASPLEGKLTQVVSGNTAGFNKGDGNIDLLQSPDNIVVTENYVYWQEDPNSFDRNHQAYIWQTDLDGNNAKVLLQIDLNQDLNFTASTFSGEFGAMIDVSDKVGEEGTFLLALQPHYWREDQYSAIDGHDLGIPPGFPGEDNQGSQVVILRNVPK